jgi:hypothetical protein
VRQAESATAFVACYAVKASKYGDWFAPKTTCGAWNWLVACFLMPTCALHFRLEYAQRLRADPDEDGELSTPARAPGVAESQRDRTSC